MTVHGFTVNQLHKRLGELIARGHGRTYVAISKNSFRDNRESVTILAVHGIGQRCVPLCDDDGGTSFTKAGVERSIHLVILAGACGANAKGDLVDESA